MDGQRFDDFARTLAGGSTRRRFLAGLAAVALGGALGHSRDAEAKPKAKPAGTGATTCPPDQVFRAGQGCVCKANGRPPGLEGCPCPSGEVRCNGVCVSTACVGGTFDPAICGCVCLPDKELCNDKCVAPCTGGKVRADKGCGCVCPAGLTDCGGVCLDTSDDLANCGACGNACPTAPACQRAVCETGVCRTTADARLNGAACDALGSPGMCTAGTCVQDTPPPPPPASCSSSSDCPPCHTCPDGTCVPFTGGDVSCPACHACSNGQCVPVNGDGVNCDNSFCCEGVCCGDSQACIDGQCTDIACFELRSTCAAASQCCDVTPNVFTDCADTGCFGGIETCCQLLFQPCNTNCDCCGAGLLCRDSPGTCCTALGFACTSQTECCNGFCNDGACCGGPGAACTGDFQCCGTRTCDGGECSFS